MFKVFAVEQDNGIGRRSARRAGVLVVTGDTKVAERGKVDGILFGDDFGDQRGINRGSGVRQYDLLLPRTTGGPLQNAVRIDFTGWQELVTRNFPPLPDVGDRPQKILTLGVALDDGFLLVGRSLKPVEETQQLLMRSLAWSLGGTLLLAFLLVVCSVVMRHRFLDVDVFLARAVALCRPQVVAAYPITPQTHTVEYISQFIADGETQSAVIQLKNALQSDPANLQARLMLASLHLRNADGAAAAKEFGILNLDVNVKGPGPGRESAVRALNNAGFKVTSITDVTPIPHNGCRPPKRRRV